MSVKNMIKKEAVALIAFTAALISCIFVPVTNYIQYIDTNLIGILFGLMAVVAGLSENNVFKSMSGLIIRKAKDTRRLALGLILSVFFLSMLITNDVALITFVPFTLMIFKKIDRSPLYVIVLQTVAANMGSALTPVGNPQNLFLFAESGMSAGEFFKLTVPITAVSLLLLIILSLAVKSEPISIDEYDISSDKIENPKYIMLYLVLFFLCILSVFKVVDTISVFASICVVIAIIQPNVFLKIDFGLIFTFMCFYIFVGNVKNIPQFTEFISKIIIDHEFESALILSQLISNVPTAVMLSAFTDNFKALILGTDIGGLGTLIASLASLISFKHYSNSENANVVRFILVFTLINLLFLAVLVIFVKSVI